MSHGDKVTALPPGFRIIASSDASPIAGMADESRNFYGVQFQPEGTHTPKGGPTLGRFLHETCRRGRDRKIPHYIGDAPGKIHGGGRGEAGPLRGYEGPGRARAAGS